MAKDKSQKAYLSRRRQRDPDVKQVRMQITLPAPSKCALEDLAEERNISASSIIRALIDSDPQIHENLNKKFGRATAYKKLGQKLRGARKDAGMSQTRLATQLNVSESFISAIERGVRPITMDFFLKFITAIGGELKITLD